MSSLTEVRYDMIEAVHKVDNPHNSTALWEYFVILSGHGYKVDEEVYETAKRVIERANKNALEGLVELGEHVESSDRIFEKDGRWYFWDETWSESEGPFDSEEIAIQKWEEYLEAMI